MEEMGEPDAEAALKRVIRWGFITGRGRCSVMVFFLNLQLDES